MKKRKSLIIILLVLTISMVGLTIAYFANSSSITNTFNTNPYGTTVTEEFVSPDNWLPGTSTNKSLTVTNSGQVDEAVRISYTESWTSRSAKNNNEEGDLPLSQNGNTAALIHFINTDDWTTVTENGTTYRYYNYKLAPSYTTSELLDYVTFNPAITNSSNCTTTESNGTKTITCNSTGNGYDDATYKLTFTIETVQYDKYKTAWGTNVNIASMKPMNASQLALKSNPISVTNYTDGNVHEMYTFNHEATEQTPALTDYRYIGNDPYNYVYFNCDDLNNQNSDTCEVWRIIGVFDVERPDPNDNTQTITERRMKLVRGRVLEDSMQWTYSYHNNNWVTTELNSYLNNDYYYNNSLTVNYGLKILSRNMINDTKYYLGGIRYKDNSDTVFGSVEDIYAYERSNNLCGSCGDDILNKSWFGKLALIYPSDVYFTYSKGIDDICYMDPGRCANWGMGYPNMSWIYNSNLIENEDDKKTIWLLNPRIDYDYKVFYEFYSGYLSENTSNDYYWVRPTLYLSSSVKIIDGDGSINNPYKLSL